jgi:hypothetical protein
MAEQIMRGDNVGKSIMGKGVQMEDIGIMIGLIITGVLGIILWVLKR